MVLEYAYQHLPLSKITKFCGSFIYQHHGSHMGIVLNNTKCLNPPTTDYSRIRWSQTRCRGEDQDGSSSLLSLGAMKFDELLYFRVTRVFAVFLGASNHQNFRKSQFFISPELEMKPFLGWFSVYLTSLWSADVRHRSWPWPLLGHFETYLAHNDVQLNMKCLFIYTYNVKPPSDVNVG